MELPVRLLTVAKLMPQIGTVLVKSVSQCI